MLDLIHKQYQSRKALSQTAYYDYSDRSKWPAYHWELYPLVDEFYHELNPFFLYNLYSKNFFNIMNFFTVKDGYITFAEFLLKNYQSIPKYGAHFLIHKSLVTLVPPNLRSYFSCWEMSQPKKIRIEDAKTVVVFGLMCDQYLGSLDKLAVRFEELKKINPEADIELYLTPRKEPLEETGKEVVTHFEVYDIIKNALPNRKINFLKTHEFNAKTHFSDLYFFDAGLDNFLVTDKYIHYYVASKGGSVNHIPLEKPKDSVFDLALSFHHNLHVTPFPEDVDSIFVDMLVNTKKFPTNYYAKDYHLQRFLKRHFRGTP